jgi:FkbM family methyltransferase
MRKELFYSPLLLLERIGEWATDQRRKNKLRNTSAQVLDLGHIDSLELLELLQPQNIQVIYDIGANVGTWALLANVVLQPQMICAFEPLPIFQQQFKALLGKTNNVSLHTVGLGNSQEELTINVAGDSSSLLPLGTLQESYFQVSKQGELRVPVTKLDSYCQQNQLPSPDLIKLDIQGYELAALQGAIKTLQTTRYVLCELSFVEFYVGQALFHEVVAFLASQNFYLMAIKKSTHTGKRLYQTDILFEKITNNS